MPVKKPAPGDGLLRLAQKEGMSVQAILQHPDNRALFACRDAGVLHEDEPDDPLTRELARLDPVTTLRGLKARLQSLGLFLSCCGYRRRTLERRRTHPRSRGSSRTAL